MNAWQIEKIEAGIVAADQSEALTAYPHIGWPALAPQTRGLVITDTPYIAPCRVRANDVQVPAVLHGARRWPEEFN